MATAFADLRDAIKAYPNFKSDALDARFCARTVDQIANPTPERKQTS